jgi:O-antigen/teichoic acid export membrane protein
MEPGDTSRLIRYAGPRAPAALFSQLLFWTDLFVLTQFANETEVGIYSAALRAGQVVVLFLTSVSLMFSPFVADLHNRGETARLDRLFKSLTRWTLAATIPAFLLLLVAPEPALRLFGSEFTGGRAALLLLLAGQFVNVATGSVGFILIMVGRTGWDLIVYAGSLALDLVLAFWLCSRYGMEGAAVANAVTFALSKWARLALVRRFVGIQPYNTDYARLIVPGAVAAAAMGLVHSTVPAEPWLLDLAATALAGTVAFGVAFLAAGLTPAERGGLRRFVSGLRAKSPT